MSEVRSADPDELAFQPANRLVAELTSGRISSTDLVSCYLQRIERSALNAIVQLDAERALATAREVDEARRRNPAVGPLAGLPITVKDAIDVEGLNTTSGCPDLAHHAPGCDATAVRRLQEAGAIVLGKTNVPTFCADIQTTNPVYGTTVNPWNSDYTPGGSSGGPAAAVADGLTAFDLASDIGGSIRIPSHLCGIYGLKPSYGIVPTDGYVDHVGPGVRRTDINVFGPLARDPDDLLLALQVLTSEAQPVGWRPHLASPPDRPLRVATWFDDPFCEVDREYVDLLEAFAEDGARLGLLVTRARPPVDVSEQWQLHLDLVLAATSYHLDEAWHRSEAATHRFWLERNEERLHLREVWHRWFADYDVLLCPVVAMPSLRRDETGTFADRTVTINGQSRPHLDTVGWCGLIGVLGLPVVVVPIGFTSAGLPVGVQVVADYLHDPTAIAFAKLAQQTGHGYVRPSPALSAT